MGVYNIDGTLIGDVGAKTSCVTSASKFDINGKRIVLFGDSRTWYDGKTYTATTKSEWKGRTCVGYQQKIADLGATVVNQGVSGNTSVQICNRIRSFDFSSYDAVFLAGGVNDFLQNSTLGSIGEIGGTFDTSTVYGAWQSAIEYILNNYPEVRIFVAIPFIAWIDGVLFPYETARIKGRIADLYQLPYIDLYTCCGVNLLNRDYFFADNVDTTGWYLHLNDYGNEMIGDIVASFISRAE